MSLGGILLCITGTFLFSSWGLNKIFADDVTFIMDDALSAGSEAMFADLGHFSYTAIQVFVSLMY